MTQPSITVVNAENGSNAAAGDINIYGIPYEQLPALLAAARSDWNTLTDAQRATIHQLEGILGGVSHRAVLAFLKDIGEAGIPLEQVGSKLQEIAGRYRDLQAQTATTSGEAPEIAALKARIRTALEAGELDQADQALAELQDCEDALIEESRLRAAQTTAQRGGLALTRLRYREAAEYFRQADKRVPSSRSAEALQYALASSDALYRQGTEFGDNAALEELIAQCHQLLLRTPREKNKLDWAGIQNNLGNALSNLGEREADTARLEDAVAAYRSALKVWTRKRVPFNWAMAQNNLGTALQTLGEQEADTAQLKNAVAAFRAALEVWTHKQVPLDWAIAQNNLGNTLRILGEQEANTALLKEAVAACRSALEVWTREPMSLDWAMAQNNLGAALLTLGKLEADTARLKEAVTACRAALEVYSTVGATPYVEIATHNLNTAQALLDQRRSATPA